MYKMARKMSVVALLAAMLLVTTGADHRDAPNVNIERETDINDVFVFVNPNDTTKVVFAMTVNPFTPRNGPVSNVAFDHNALYEFKIDNTGDAVEDLVIQVIFDKPTPSAFRADQKFSVIGPVPVKKGGNTSTLLLPKDGSGVLNGVSDGATIATDSSRGIRALCGLREDPFFFDSGVVAPTIGLVPGPAPTRAPVDTFANVNISAIVVEVPITVLTGSTGNTIRFWGTTSLASSTKRSAKTAKDSFEINDNGGKRPTKYVQVDRMGLPVLNTVAIPNGFNFGGVPRKQDLFNISIPSRDRELFRAEVVTAITAYSGGDAAHANTVADLLLPDVLTLDMTSTNGFSTLVNGSPALNGRNLADDTVDTILSVATKGVVTGDGVNANDVPLLTDFPFFAPRQ